jgi:pyruvate formate lyase activating enzyme
MMLSRRCLLARSLRAGATFGASALFGPLLPLLSGAWASGASASDIDDIVRKAPTARFWSTTASSHPDCQACHGSPMRPDATHAHGRVIVKCLACARECVIAEGERGMCRARMNVGGELKSLVYGRPITIHVDPIEKKPFYHFLPGSQAYSLATSGCPLRCRFCQNWQISQASPEDYDGHLRSADDLASEAAERQAPVVAFTYNEPTVFIEYLLDIAAAARKRGRRSVIVSCGYMREEPLTAMLEVLDGVKIDLKGFSPDFYRNVSSAELEPVKRSLRQVARSGTHLEIVNLVVPTLNDSEDMLRELCAFVAGELGPQVPVHFTRFHPDYQLPNLAPTPVATLERAWEIAKAAGLLFPYVGNVPGHPYDNTICPGCGKVLIERAGFVIMANRLQDGACDGCGRAIPGVWA